jgi:hypothetical protein
MRRVFGVCSDGLERSAHATENLDPEEIESATDDVNACADGLQDLASEVEALS